MATLEERIKFKHGLTIGTHLVQFTHAEQSRKAMVRISARGTVHYLPMPSSGDMYSTWKRVRGDMTGGRGDGAVIVWGARDPELMRMFDGEPVAVIPVMMKSTTEGSTQ